MWAAGLEKLFGQLLLMAIVFCVPLEEALGSDLGGDCCNELEERVSELEATSIVSGTRNLSVRLSGYIHTAVMVWDDGRETKAIVGEKIASGSRSQVQDRIDKANEWSAGYLMEFALDMNRIKGGLPANDPDG